MGNSFYDKESIKGKMPKVGNTILKNRGEIRGEFTIIKEYENYFLAISKRLGFKECFSKASFFTQEIKKGR
ncbi:hypothetical protein [Clostridium felsineum]|uniref:hypothetical protein n=1 Tax=Clostridium felsineum TaxID=36839 RepID=UPI00098C4417|nr:hypothetical protein [Clostridium felsineum]URZ00642.1 hypothetical protein CLAUR_006300 [Clostridium felsineum]